MYSEKIIEGRLGEIQSQLAKKLNKRKFSFNRYSPDDVEDWNHRLASAYDEEGNQKRYLTDEEQMFVLNELTISKYDFEYWSSRYCWVSGDDGRLTKLAPRVSQRKLLSKWAECEETLVPQAGVHKVPLIVAKARRVGATVLSEAAIAHGCMLRGQTNGLIASDVPEGSLELFKIQDRIYKYLPVWMKPHMQGRVKSEHMMFDKLDSSIQIGHGSQKNPLGQGIRLDFIHLTEAATWLQTAIQQIDEDILPAFFSSHVPTSLWVIESTGKVTLNSDQGRWFKSEYYNAKSGGSQFKSIFLSWYDAPEMHHQQSDGVEFVETTKAVAERIKRETGYECTKEQLTWYQNTRRHYELKGDLSSFLREFPSTDDECFQYNMPCAWPIEVIDKIRNQVPPILSIFDVDFRRKKLLGEMRPVPWVTKSGDAGLVWDGDPRNRVILYEEPKNGFTYVAGGDAAYGIEGKDSASVQINRVGSRFAPDKLVAEFWGICSPDDLAVACWILGHIYTDRETGQPALMAIETNGPGLTTQTELNKMGYPNFYTFRVENRIGGGWTKTMGWQTTPSTRPLLTKKGVKAITEGNLIITSPFFIEDMKGFVNYGWKTKSGVDGYEYFAHSPDTHDDRLMAGFIAYYVSHDYDRQDVADERRKYFDTLTARQTKQPRNHQALDTAYDELIEGFEESQDWL